MKRFTILMLAVVSMSVLATEIAWTRLFSAEFFYTFAFLILSLAVSGLGLGALALRLFPALNRMERLPDYFLGLLLVYLLVPVAVFKIAPDFSQVFASLSAFGGLVLLIFLLALPYFIAGIILAMLFRSDSQRISRLYMGDLLGAALGIPLMVWLMNYIGTPKAVFLLPMLLVFVIFYLGKWHHRGMALTLLAVGIILSFNAAELLKINRQERAPVIYEHWDALAKIKVYQYGENDEARGINIDNAANSPVYKLEGTLPLPDSLRSSYGIDVGYLIKQFDACSFLSLGSGGGSDVFQALDYGASKVYAVEVIPHINEMMLDGFLTEYTGRIYHDSRVEVITEDARAFIRRYPESFDLIYALSANSFAALASGSFALCENYLFTTEAFRDYWRALSPEGFMMMEHQFYVPRMVSMLTEALNGEGIAQPEEHFAVYDLPKMRRKMILLSKAELSPELIANAFAHPEPESQSVYSVLWPLQDSTSNIIADIVTQGWEGAQPNSPIELSPTYDDRPFTAQLGRWQNLSAASFNKVLPYEFFGFPLAKVLIVIILGVNLLIVLPFTLLPFSRKNEAKLAAPSWFYFLLVGVAFMMVEIVLIQQYTLLIGSGIYPLLTVLMVLLLGNALGSRLSEKIPVSGAVTGIISWIIINNLAFDALVNSAGLMEQSGRIIIAAVLIFPLGIVMGVPFPKGGKRAGDLVDWAFAVNGVGSVSGSALALLAAFHFGFSATYLFAGILYLTAFMFYGRRSWVKESVD
ncbi:MAG TPA: hypothetical protein ENN84_09820 [Candidatus Marinimicrobia bacterium]|nr:hypothetical protein [Candidatus Neomarinimicrobiota bacterium]